MILKLNTHVSSGLPVYLFTLFRKKGSTTRFDLTGKTVVFEVWGNADGFGGCGGKSANRVKLYSVPGTVTTALAGECEFQMTAESVGSSGSFDGYIRVTETDEPDQIFPYTGSISVTIEPL